MSGVEKYPFMGPSVENLFSENLWHWHSILSESSYLSKFTFWGRWGLTKRSTIYMFIDIELWNSCFVSPVHHHFRLFAILSDDCQMNVSCLPDAPPDICQLPIDICSHLTDKYHMYARHIPYMYFQTSIGGSLDLSHLRTVWSNIYFHIYLSHTREIRGH